MWISDVREGKAAQLLRPVTTIAQAGSVATQPFERAPFKILQAQVAASVIVFY